MPLRESVFVVEDDGSMRTSIGRLLREHGFTPQLFESAEGLLEHGEFDKALCFVLDVNLGGLSGIALGRRLAEQGVKAPVIYITGNDSPSYRAAAFATGCIAYLTKPFAAQSLIAPITMALAV